MLDFSIRSPSPNSGTIVARANSIVIRRHAMTVICLLSHALRRVRGLVRHRAHHRVGRRVRHHVLIHVSRASRVVLLRVIRAR
jgi:hypothetical protein